MAVVIDRRPPPSHAEVSPLRLHIAAQQILDALRRSGYTDSSEVRLILEIAHKRSKPQRKN